MEDKNMVEEMIDNMNGTERMFFVLMILSIFDPTIIDEIKNRDR